MKINFTILVTKIVQGERKNKSQRAKIKNKFVFFINYLSEAEIHSFLSNALP